MRVNWAEDGFQVGGARHGRRMSLYAEYLARNVGLEEDRCKQLRLASVVHDIGKIDVPDRILLKPGSLTAGEFEVVKRHAMAGYLMLTGSKSRVFDLAASIALTHHERFDGSGYPQGLEREMIPIEGRIAAVADVFDALTTKRPYKEAFTLDRSVEIMRGGRENHFDPELLDFFLGSLNRAIEFVGKSVDRSESRPN